MGYTFVIGELSHETNSFSPIRTTIKHFEETGIFRGEDIIRAFRGTKTPIGGFISVAEKTGAKVIGTVSASAVPSGIVSREDYEKLRDEIINGIRQAGKYDAVLLSLHGAMVVEGLPDAEGDILSRVRASVGRSVPVAAVLDYHGNISDSMVEQADGLFGYNTYPHVDGYERGVEAAEFVIGVIEQKYSPVSACERPLLMPAVVPARTGWGPIKKLLEKAFEFEKMPGVINVSVYGGFPYSDIYESGLALLATTDGDMQLAQQIAKHLAGMAWEMRHEFVRPLLLPEEAVKAAMQKSGPVVLADVADNTGGGASGDGTAVLEALLKFDAKDAVVVTIPDPEAVAHAFSAGVGGAFDCLVGGKIDDKHGKPVRVRGKVRMLMDGRFVYRGPIATGVTGNMGRTAVIEAGGVEIIINEFRFQPLDAAVPRAVGIEPLHKQIIVLKSAVHYRASYEPIASEIIEVDGPGLSSPTLHRFPWKNVRRPIFPLDEM